MTQEQIDNVFKIIEVLKWPAVALIAILLFRQSIIGLINRVKGIKGGGYGIETESSARQQESDKLLKTDESKIEIIEKGLNLFSKETRSLFQHSILLETELDKINDDKEIIATLKNYSEALYLLLHFERIYYNIFGSQIRLMNHLNSSFHETTDSIKFFYDDAVKINSELGKYPYENYLEFLEIRNLVQISEDNKIQITWLGRDFLKFMVQMGLTDIKPN